MCDTGKTNDELLLELKELKQENESLKIAYQKDIKENKQAQEKLRESEEFNRRIVETANEGIWVTDCNENIIYVNNKMADMLGYSIIEMIGKNSSDFLFADDINDLNLKIEERKCGKIGSYEERFIKKNNSLRWFHISSTPIFEEEGVYTGSFAMLTDITERKLAEEKLRETEELNKRIVETATEGIWVTDNFETIIYVNEKMANMLGYSVNEMLGKNSVDFLFSEDIGDLQNKISERKCGKIGSYDERLLCKNEAILWVHISSTPLFDKDEVYTGSFAMLTDITERKHAEEKLRESEEFNRRIVETAIEGIWVTDSNENVIYVNQKMAEMLGYTESEMLGKFSSDFLFKEDINDLIYKIDERKSGKIGSYEERLVRKNKTVLWVHISSSPLFDTNGQYTGSFAMLTDITERKLAEEKLRESELLNKRIVETAIEGVWVTDNNETVIYVNKKMADMLGYSENEMLGKYSSDFLFKEDIQNLNLKIEERKNGKIGSYEERLVPKNKTVLWVHISSTPLFDDDRHYTGSFAMLTDITERKLAEEKLRESEEFNRRIVETAVEGIWVTDSNETVIYVNEKIIDMLGYAENDMLGKNSADFLFKEDIQELKLKIDERKSGIIGSYEERLIRKNKTVLWVHISSKPIFNNDGAYTGSFAMLTDITERKLAEEKLRESEEFNRRIVETAIEGIWVTDSNETVIYVNNKMADMLGYSENEMLGKNSADFLLKKDKLEFKIKIDERKAGITGSYEERLIRKNKAVLWVHISSKPIFNNDGVYTGSFAMLTDITERKMAEEKLRESEEFNRRIVETAIEGIWVTDSNETVIYINQKMADMLGFSENEMLGKNSADFLFAEDINNLQQKIEERKTGVFGYYEERLNRKDGTVLWAHISSTPLFDNDGLYISSFAMLTDITKRRLADEAVVKLSMAVKHSPASIIVTDNSGNIEYVNPKFCELTGYTIDDVLGKNPRVLKLTNTLSNIYKNLWNTIINGEEWHGEFVNLTKNKEEHIEKVIIAPIKDEKGKIINFIAVMEDITELKKIETIIEEKNEQQRILINNLPAMIYFKDAHLKYQLVNESFAKKLKLPINKIIGKTDVELSRSDIYEKIDKELIQSNNSQYDFECNYTDSEGKVIWTLTSKVLYKDEKDNILGIIGIVQDITERKQAEVKLNKLYDELKTSNEIIEVNLYQKNFLVEELTESETKLKKTVAIKDKFFSIVAHDIRGPFSGFLGLTDLMAKEVDELSKEEVKQMSLAINKSANTVYILIEDLLMWTRSQTDSIPFIPELLDLYEISLNTFFALKQNAINKNIELINSVQPVTHITGDRNMLRTVLRNLVSNAIKFTNEFGKIEIGINHKQYKDDLECNYEYIEIFVKDDGIGIPEENIDKLFKIEEHYTTPGTNKEVGTGLGLVLCKEFIEKHGGKIRVESKEGEGTTFYFTLQNTN